MAQMIPNFGPAATESRAELSIYATLKEQLSDEFVVIHSLPWLRSAAIEIGSPFVAPTGEIDFVILHHELGVLAVEIKGGRYRIDGAAFVPIGSGPPLFVLQQTRKNVHGVAHWLSGKASIRWRIGYAMCFPDSAFPENKLAPGAFDSNVSQRITLDIRDLPKLGDRVIDLMRYWQAALTNSALGAERMQAIVNELCPQYDGTPHWSHRIQYDNHFWLQLTLEQKAIADRILRSRRGIVTGWPGTGKTLIGVELARRLSSAGERVLFVTYNVLLCEHLREQLGNTSCHVYTWHKLCNFARDQVGRATADENWYDNECLEDLKAATLHGSIEFDVLVVDEAQALRPTWWEYLAIWFKDKPIFAFCDETQVFSFERATTSLEQLCQIVGERFFHLSVVMRMPRAVTDRLIEVKASPIQISSPRALDPDAIKEIVVDDWAAALQKLVPPLHEREVKRSEIIFISKTRYLHPAIQAFFDANLDLKHFLVSQFRGMEAPIIVVIEADSLSESELFSAYSRATTACFALFSAEAIPDTPKGAFLAAIVCSSENQEIIRQAKYQRSVACRLSNHDMERIRSIKSVELTWSRTLTSWIVSLKRETPMSLWVDFLREQLDWPVLFTYDDEPDFLRMALGKNSDDLEKPVKLCICERCNTTTPHSLLPSECMVCRGVLGTDDPILMRSDVQRLIDHDAVITTALTATTLQDLFLAYHHLPFLLGATAVGMYAMQSARATDEIPLELPSRSSLYRAAFALAQAKTLLSGPGELISLQTIVLETLHDDFERIGLSKESWHKHLANALNRLYLQGRLSKVRKGVYSL
jgi:hypothetical protein